MRLCLVFLIGITLFVVVSCWSRRISSSKRIKTHLTCTKGYKAVANNGKVLNTCKTGLNDNCVTVFIKGDTPAKSAYLYGCYPSYVCSKFASYLAGLPGSYCKMCDSKYDKCNQDL